MNNDLDEGKLVMAALTNSDAYKSYVNSKSALKTSCMKNCDSEINDIEDGIKEYEELGYKQYERNCNYKDEYISGGSYYITNYEIEYICNYFKNKGYIVSYKLNEYKTKRTWWGKKISRIARNVQIIIDWDFAKVI